MQPAFVLPPPPTVYRRQPPISDSPAPVAPEGSFGSQHCAAMGVPSIERVAASLMHVCDGLLPFPPSSTAVGGVHAVGDAVGDAVVGDKVGAALGDALGAALGEALGGSVGG